MDWRGKRVLVTGAGGFIGSHLTEKLLALGAELTAFVHYNARDDWGMLEENCDQHTPNLRVLAGDITDPVFVGNACTGKDVVFHLAALIGIPYSYYAPESYINTNVRGTLQVMEACRQNEVGRVVHTSTSEVYGTALYTPIDEKHPLQGQSPYSASKIGADKIAESYYCSFGVPVTTVRPFNTYGPRQSTRAVIPTIITQALAGRTVRLGSLTPVRDLTFVADTVDGFIALAESERSIGRTVNLGTGRGVSIGELADRIVRMIDPGIAIITDEERIRPENSEVMNLISDNRLAEEISGWRPRYSLDEGLSITIEWMRDHLTEYKPGKYTV